MPLRRPDWTDTEVNRMARDTMKLSRRELLALSARAGLGGALSLGTGVVGPRFRLARAGTTTGVREIRLEAREVRWELAPGKMVTAMAYNGQVPGPEIRLTEGERVRVLLKNSLAEPTTIHWHGVDVPNAMDGVPGVTQKPVSPGETFAYEFQARPAGTRWYHTHVAEHDQLDRGLAAPLIIEPARPDPGPVDREYTLVLDDWVTGTGSPVPPTREGIAGGRGGRGGMMDGMMGQGGMGGTMGQDHTPAYDAMTVNGKAYPATERLRVRQGERVRLRLINASSHHTHVVRLAGHRLRVTHTDGNPLEQPVDVDALPIAPAERYDVAVVAERPGAWILTCLAPGHRAAGEQVLLVYEGHEGAIAAAPGEGVAGLDLWQYGLGRGRDVLSASSGRVRVYDLALSGGMMGSDVWTINGKRYPRTDPLRLRRGDLARVRFVNHSMEAHPMHLHGQSFKLLAVNGARYARPLVKDTVDVEPHMGAVVVEFPAHNAGDWFLHCHKPMHMDGGMIVLAQIG
ncbi:MAG TPA: multicopper oxidase family protein [Methylomirabilota bacterium]|nr:multicopper oxidase family protein [Methylomirabilota bacterium]